MSEARFLAVTADDFGIGPSTTRGIVELAAEGIVTATVLLVNSPYARAAVHAWRRAGVAADLGWHPCLTIDRPVLPTHRVPTLVDAQGAFLTLGQLMRRLMFGRVSRLEIEEEFSAQLNLFRELTGMNPPVVNTHHHIQVFSAVGASLRNVLDRLTPRPYVRRVCEPWSTIFRVPGARLKRIFLNHLGRAQAVQPSIASFPGNEWLAGVTNPSFLNDPEFFTRWLKSMPGKYVELTCHPGHLDATLVGRDGSFKDGQIHRRPREWDLLKTPQVRQVIAEQGFKLIRPSEIAGICQQHEKLRHPA